MFPEGGAIGLGMVWDNLCPLPTGWCDWWSCSKCVLAVKRITSWGEAVGGLQDESHRTCELQIISCDSMFAVGILLIHYRCALLFYQVNKIMWIVLNIVKLLCVFAEYSGAGQVLHKDQDAKTLRTPCSPCQCRSPLHPFCISFS